jgi:pimeloyl-ACP methyl ester carboxylesterase
MQKKIVTEGKQISYDLYGEGNPVILLHGFAEDRRIWQNQINLLADQYRLIVPDLPGSGLSDVSADMSMEGMADSIQKVLLHELSGTPHFNHAVVIGHSMGGYIALAFAEKYPELTTGLGLFHSTAYADSSEKRTARQRSIQFIRNHGSYEFLQQLLPNLFSESFRMHNKNLVGKMIAQYSEFDKESLIIYYEKMMVRPDKTSFLATTGKPILFIIGQQDSAVPFDQSLQQCHLPQLSYIHILKNAGHMGMWEEPEKTNTSIASFLSDVYVY